MNGVMHLQGRPLRYRVRASSRARRLSLRMRESDAVEIVVPPFLVSVNPERVLREMEGWILRTMDRMERRPGSVPARPLGDRSVMTFMGKRVTVRVGDTDRKRITINLEGDELWVLHPPGPNTDIGRALRRWCLAEAKTVIPRRVAELNTRWNLPCTSVVIRNQKTRWGSCSRKGTLSLNWRLVLLPSSVMDYLIFHELAHLKELNHSPRFWKVVATLCPDYREEERWLRKHGRSVPL
jgi:predicted metal-dependent hydrolase